MLSDQKVSSLPLMQDDCIEILNTQLRKAGSSLAKVDVKVFGVGYHFSNAKINPVLTLRTTDTFEAQILWFFRDRN